MMKYAEEESHLKEVLGNRIRICSILGRCIQLGR